MMPTNEKKVGIIFCCLNFNKVLNLHLLLENI